jgi:hypothetical protein
MLFMERVYAGDDTDAVPSEQRCGQDSFIRSMPSCAAEAISRPSAANIRPNASPRPPCAVGDVCV